MNNIIKEYYDKYNFPASQKLYQLLKENGHDIKKKARKKLFYQNKRNMKC